MISQDSSGSEVKDVGARYGGPRVKLFSKLTFLCTILPCTHCSIRVSQPCYFTLALQLCSCNSIVFQTIKRHCYYDQPTHTPPCSHDKNLIFFIYTNKHFYLWEFTFQGRSQTFIWVGSFRRKVDLFYMIAIII